MSAYAFVEQVRIHHAIEALKHSATSIIQIALNAPASRLKKSCRGVKSNFLSFPARF